MATIVIRKLNETVKRKLQVRAARNGRSMEAEVRASLTQIVEEAPEGLVRAGEEDLGTAIRKRFAAIGGVDLKLPPRRFSGRHLPGFDR